MRYLLIASIVLMFASCQGGATGASKAAAAGSQDAKASANNGTAKSANDATGNSAVAKTPIDTVVLQKDLNTLLTGIVTGKMDTTALKQIAARTGMTTQQMLSDSGINALYGNSGDPSVKAAGDMLKKLRDGIGLTPDKLDTLKKAADLLNSN
jgi:hypothetical protein